MSGLTGYRSAPQSTQLGGGGGVNAQEDVRKTVKIVTSTKCLFMKSPHMVILKSDVH